MEVTDEVTLSREGWGRGGVSAGVPLQSDVMGGGAGPLCSVVCQTAGRWSLLGLAAISQANSARWLRVSVCRMGSI